MRRATVVFSVAWLVLTGSAGAATQVGQTFTPSPICDSSFTNLTATSPAGLYTVPFDGVIASWSYQADPTPPAITFKVARSAGAKNFTIVGGSGLQSPAPGALHSAEIRAPVKAGDVIGIYTANAECGRVAGGYETYYRPGDTPSGTTATAFTGPASYQLDVSAQLEPDCDSDGLGDESQDFNTGSCPPAPEATITKGPRDLVRTKRKRKRATFEFGANEPATFECALDRGPFAPCASPYSVKVRKGRHLFEVHATDSGGNLGPTVSDTWKVKRKRSRHRG